MRFTLRQLGYFVAVAEANTLAQAAAQLNVSQPSVSVAISNLEIDLGVQLFVRHHARGVSLTPSGKRLLPEAQSLLRHADEFQTGVMEVSGGVSGNLTVGCFVTIAAMYMPKLITGFTRQHPGTSISLTEGNLDEITKGLQSSVFELALAYDLGLPASIHFELLSHATPYALLPRRHKLARQAEVSLSDLCNEPLILLDIPPSRNYFPALFSAENLSPKIGLSSPSFEVVRGMVGQGAGYSLLVTKPQSNFTYDGSKVISKPIAGDIQSTNIGLAWQQGLRPTRLMSAFVDYCRETI